MRIAIINGSAEDERHFGRLSEKIGQAVSFVSPPGAQVVELASGQRLEPAAHDADVLVEVLRLLETDSREEAARSDGAGRPSSGPRALVFDARERLDGALKLLGAVRRDAYFERVGTLLIVRREQAPNLSLPSGFDDFVLAPVDALELALRIRAVVRRRKTLAAQAGQEDAGVVVDETSRDVIVDGHTVQLTAREFALFTYLCEWRGKVLSREHLLARVWGSRYSGGRRTVDIHVRRLRAKLGASLSIETLRGSGYRLRREPSTEAAAPVHAHAHAQIPEPFSKVS